MPIALVHADTRTLLVRVTGDITYPEVQRILDEMSRAMEIHGAVNLLADCRGVTSTLSVPELKVVAEDLRPFVRKGMTHFALVTDSSFMYGIGRMFAVFLELSEANMSVFKDVQSAQDWLDEVRPG